jgi:hypothetical protein
MYINNIDRLLYVMEIYTFAFAKASRIPKGVQPNSYPICTGVFFSESKALRAWV